MNKCRKLVQDINTDPISFVRHNLVNKDSKILTIGSCFAYEIANYLGNKGYVTLTKQSPDTEDLIWYNTFTIRDEFRRVVGKFTQSPDDYWDANGKLQDPYRRLVFAPTKEELRSKVDRIDSVMREGIMTADVVIITLGLTEVFFQNSNGNAMCASPGYFGGVGFDSQVRFTTFAENYQNISEALEILHEVNPKCKVVLTVSPVPLGMTFDNVDHIIANTTSKSTLRTVASEIVRKYDFCKYFHSYEIANALSRNEVYYSDGRHVTRETVAKIMETFEQMFVVKQ